MEINGVLTQAKEFGFDGCHKIYLINSDDEKQELIGYGYNILPINKLRKTYKNACPLKFISNADLKTTIVPQGKTWKI